MAISSYKLFLIAIRCYFVISCRLLYKPAQMKPMQLMN